MVILILLANGLAEARPQSKEWVRVAPDRRSFILESSGRRFTPWGFNYDHDEQGRLIEDYWEKEWPKVEQDFREMKDLGANVVRVHLQLGKFMKDAGRPDETSLERLGRLLELAERLGLYLDLTGLGCYHKKDVPAWYDAMTEPDRWAVQSRFWEAVARRCAGSPAVFCYDLMNEPVVTRQASTRRLARRRLRRQALRPVHHARPGGQVPARSRPPVGPYAEGGDPQARPPAFDHRRAGPLEPRPPRSHVRIRPREGRR